MTPEQIDRVFGRGRLRMMTGEHVEVYREAVAEGERRRYTKRFLDTGHGDFGQWTEREWRILARLIGHGIRCVPDVVQFDGGGVGGMRLVQTYDAGVTVDQWATLLPVSRGGVLHRHVFEDCAHWWALAHHCVAALDEIHRLSLVHLDIKGDNICIPFGPANFDPGAPDARLYPIFPRLALIDFAFSLVSRESLAVPLPIGWQRDYDYQSPRLLAALEAGRAGDIEPTKELDWRCDLYSLAAMLKRYLPDEDQASGTDDGSGWTAARYRDAKALIFRIREVHDRDFPHWRPHQEMIVATAAKLREPDLAESLEYGWTLARDVAIEPAVSTMTPMTRIAPSLQAVHVSPLAAQAAPTAVTIIAAPLTPIVARAAPVRGQRSGRATHATLATLVALGAIAAPSHVGNPVRPRIDDVRAVGDSAASRMQPGDTGASAAQPPRARQASAEPTTADGATGSPAASTAGSVAPVGAAVSPSAAVAQATSAVVAPVNDSSPAPASAPARPAHQPTTQPRYPIARASGAPAKEARSKPASPAHAPRAPAARGMPLPGSAKGASQLAASRPPMRVAHAMPPVTTPRTAPPVNNASATAVPTPSAPLTSSPTDTQPNIVVAQNDSQASSGETTGTVPSQTASSTTQPRPASDAPQASAPPVANAATIAPSAPTPPAAAVPPKAPAPSTRHATPAPRNQDLRSQLSALWRVLRGRDQPPAPVEERIAQASPPPASAVAPPVTTATPRGVAPPVTAAAPRVVVPATPRAAAPPSSPPVSAAPSSSIDSATTRAPAVAPPITVQAPAPPDYAARGRRMLADAVPRVAAQAQADIARVMWIATNASLPSQEASVIEAARASWASESVPIDGSGSAPSYARQMQDGARHTFASGGSIDQAIDAQLRAFGADPRDADVASFLAYLHLKASPPQAEAARELALYAIALRGPRRTARVDDWQTFAIASALTGRNHDARQALYVAMALARNVERSCRTALAAYGSYGERMRAPVEAMLYRLHVQGRDYESPYCAWPPDWGAVARSQ